ncbi:hypothetical protein AALD01_13670, partial [Oscillospiraceae bacterium 21-37]
HRDHERHEGNVPGRIAAGDGERTGYTGYAEKLPGAIFCVDVAVADQNLVTSQGPATGYPFAFKLAEALSKDTAELRERLMYNFAGGITA